MGGKDGSLLRPSTIPPATTLQVWLGVALYQWWMQSQRICVVSTRSQKSVPTTPCMHEIRFSFSPCVSECQAIWNSHQCSSLFNTCKKYQNSPSLLHHYHCWGIQISCIWEHAEFARERNSYLQLRPVMYKLDTEWLHEKAWKLERQH